MSLRISPRHRHTPDQVGPCGRFVNDGLRVAISSWPYGACGSVRGLAVASDLVTLRPYQ
jgi:hypothetical protein